MKTISIEQKKRLQESLSWAKDYRTQKKYDEALKACNEAIALQLDSAYAYYLRATVYEKLEKQSEAFQDFRKVTELALDETYTDGVYYAYYIRGVARAKLGKNSEALQDLSKAIELEPEHVAAYSACSVVYGQLGKWSEALQELSKVIEIDPDNENARRGRQICCENLSDQDQKILDQLSSGKRKGLGENPEETVTKKPRTQTPKMPLSMLFQLPSKKPKGTQKKPQGTIPCKLH